MDNNHIRLATKDCPGTDCDDDRNEDRIIYWDHKCGNTSYLDRQANVICYNCDTKYLILNAKFKCKYDNQYKDCDYLKVGRMLTALSAIEAARVNISNFNKKEFTAFLNSVTESLFDVKK